MAIGKTGTIVVYGYHDGTEAAAIYVDYREDYDVAGNYSTITITGMRGDVYYRAGSFGSSGSITIDGALHYAWWTSDWVFSGQSGANPFVNYTGMKFPTSGNIYHDVDGRKNITIIVTLNSVAGGSPTYTCSGSIKSVPIELTELHTHSWDGEITVAPTTETEGVKTYTCAGCGLQSIVKLPKVGALSPLLPGAYLKTAFGKTKIHPHIRYAGGWAAVTSEIKGD